MKSKIINIILIVLLIMALSFSIKQCSSIKREYIDNIEILNDTIKYYKDKTGTLVATKHGYETDIKNLKYLNDSLYKEIKSLKAKGKVTTATQFSGTIINELLDTIYIVEHDTITKGFYKDFNFNNQWRLLEGNINYKNDSVGVSITKDEVMFDYVVAMDKDNVIYIKSKNPYVKYNEISGYFIPKAKKKHWSIGPSVGYSYDVQHNTFAPTVGITLQYGLIRW